MGLTSGSVCEGARKYCGLRELSKNELAVKPASTVKI